MTTFNKQELAAEIAALLLGRQTSNRRTSRRFPVDEVQNYESGELTVISDDREYFRVRVTRERRT